MPFKMIDNLERLAVNLREYILSLKNHQTINQIFTEVEEEYTGILKMPVIGSFMKYFRSRGDAIGDARQEIATRINPIDLLEDIVKFIQDGNWESTSSNTSLMTKLIKQLGGYEEETDEYIWKSILPDFTRIFIQKANLSIQDYRKQQALYLEKQQQRDEAPVNIGTEHVTATQKLLQDKLVFQQKPHNETSRMDLESGTYAKVAGQLETLFGANNTSRRQKLLDMQRQQDALVDARQESKAINRLDFTSGKYAHIAESISSTLQSRQGSPLALAPSPEVGKPELQRSDCEGKKPVTSLPAFALLEQGLHFKQPREQEPCDDELAQEDKEVFGATIG